MSQTDPQLTGCRDGCGKAVASPGQVAWYFLCIQGRWRCPECQRALEKADGRVPVTA